MNENPRGIIRVAQRRDPYARIPRRTIDRLATDGQLDTLGVLIWILGHSDGWEVRIGPMLRTLRIGRDKWNRMRRYLEQLGLYRSIKVRATGGRIEWVHTVHDEPPQLDECDSPAMAGLPVNGQNNTIAGLAVDGSAIAGAAIDGWPGHIRITETPRIPDVPMTDVTRARTRSNSRALADTSKRTSPRRQALNDQYVERHARPGETWEAAKMRLSRELAHGLNRDTSEGLDPPLATYDMQGTRR